MINSFQPSLGDAELEAVREVFASAWIGRGARVDGFEQHFARHLGVGREHVTSTNSCTEAMFTAMELLGVGPGDEVVIPTIGFVGAANAVASRGARPVFCDVDERTLNPSVADVEACLTPATRGVLLIHYAGRPGAVAEIAALCRELGLWLVEDAANAQSSWVDGRACGTFGDLGMWSFDWGKTAVALDGAVIHARDPELAERARKVSYLGLENVSGFSEAFRTATRWWEFEVSSFSRRSIMNDVQAAVGSVQLARLPEFIARREEISRQYDRALAGMDGVLLPPPLPAGHTSSWYMYWIQVPAGIRDEVARFLFDAGIYVTFRYHPLHRVRAYGHRIPLPKAERAAGCTLCLPVHQAMGDHDVATVVEHLGKAVGSALFHRSRTT